MIYEGWPKWHNFLKFLPTTWVVHWKGLRTSKFSTVWQASTYIWFLLRLCDASLVNMLPFITYLSNMCVKNETELPPLKPSEPPIARHYTRHIVLVFVNLDFLEGSIFVSLIQLIPYVSSWNLLLFQEVVLSSKVLSEELAILFASGIAVSWNALDRLLAHLFLPSSSFQSWMRNECDLVWK